MMLNHQNNCSLPNGNYKWNRELFGLGSNLHAWSAALCNAIQKGVRVISTHHLKNETWVWLDRERCQSGKGRSRSSLSCYFPHAELQCQQDPDMKDFSSLVSISDISNPFFLMCEQPHNVSDWRAATTEMLFSHVSPLLQEEAERQLRLVFRGDAVPPNLITVHIRWGDKKYEYKLKSVETYIKAVEEIKTMRGDSLSSPTNIFLSTEDPEAVRAFSREKPRHWKVYLDHFYHEMLPHRPEEDIYNKIPLMSRQLNGKVGLWALGSLLVAMEANDFVLTRTSNWSRLMDELRKNILDPRCNHCTHIVDVSRNVGVFQ